LVDRYISTGSAYHPLDLARTVQYFAMDAITALAFGAPIGCLETDSDMHSWIKTVEDMLPAMVYLTVFPWLNALLRSFFVRRFILPSERDPTGMGRVIGIAKATVASRFGADKKEQKDMMGSFIRHGLTQDELESETLLQIIAGSDTTASGIRGTLLHLITSPDIYCKLRAEIDDATLSSPVQDIEAKGLPYLQACIREGLRIWPPATSPGFKLVPKGGDTIAGVYLPQGTKVGMSIYNVMRDKAVFGEDADVFRPERWLDAGDEKRDTMEKQLDMLFSPGKWMCLGKSIAWLELNKVFVEVCYPITRGVSFREKVS
jgi:cytochrome P450